MDVFPILEELKSALPAGQNQELKKRLSVYLNDLLLHDFSTLVQLLYRVDVPEKKLKSVLLANPKEDAGNLIADLMIQRQLEKQQTRNSFHVPPPLTEEERW